MNQGDWRINASCRDEEPDQLFVRGAEQRKAKLVCPSETAYGDQGSGSIPGGAALSSSQPPPVAGASASAAIGSRSRS